MLEFIFLFEFREKVSTSYSWVLSQPPSDTGTVRLGQDAAVLTNTNNSTALICGKQEKAFSPLPFTASCGVLKADYKFEDQTDLKHPSAFFFFK